jgi:hypothetical protein
MEMADRIAHRLKLSDLRVLREVVGRGGMSKAAQTLNLTQPAVSKAIAQMERVLGVQLLERSRHGATPGECRRPGMLARLMIRSTGGSISGRRTLSGCVMEYSGTKANPTLAITIA